ncbi:RNA polymerase sigma-70 factor, ECF subfamily [Pedobacter caeni]|uniref:RNA polymerase sigma-70 factor, ECF subfamily n=2 Tax=Pedobacter caeni TaxID=288992 RepID=A0A1M4ZB31_9SPHI|nr:RNA polymerase sigma-70 factor, ECF subfamily [Pedobacter caeni]
MIFMSSLFIGDIQEDTLVFDRIYEQYHQLIYANIFKLIKSAPIAEDILQDVFFSLWENRMKIDIQKSVSGWLFIVSYNKSLSILRKKVKEAVEYVENYDAYDDISEEIFLNEAVYESQLQILEEAVVALPPQRQKVFRLCHFEGKSQEEVAKILGLSTASVKDYLKHSKRFIREYVLTKTHLNQAIGLAIILTLY